MPRLGSRTHKLPHRLDYTLIPAPLDLSLPLMTEKAALPAIIVTPSSPSSDHDFSIAFLAPPAKPSMLERITAYAPTKSPNFHFKARTLMIIFVIIFVLICHVVTHRLAAQRPYLDFSVQSGEAHIVQPSVNWFNFRSFTDTQPLKNVKHDSENIAPLASTEIPPVSPSI